VDFRDHSIEYLATAVRSGSPSAADLVEAALDRIAALDDRLGAFVLVDPGRARAEAADVDRQLGRGDDPGPLAGIPLAVKDVTDVAGWPTTHGSMCHRHEPPATADHPMVARLRAAGCVLVGKTNTPEHGWKADTTNALFGATYNPWSTDRSPGGSSGGSAAAVAAGLVPLATGSDGGGSLRIPSAVCGLSGMKATLGRVPNGTRHPPGWWYLSTAGPMAATVRDVAVALDVCIGRHPNDLHSHLPDVGSLRAACDHPRNRPRIGWAPTLGYARLDDEVLRVCEAALDALAGAGCEIVELGGPFDADPLNHWLAVSSVCNLRSLLPCRGTEDWDRIDPGLRALIEHAESSVSALDLLAAEDAAHDMVVRLAAAFERCDVIACPTTAGITPLSGEPGTINGEPDLNWVQLTYPFNMTRSPAGTTPAGLTSGGLPVGLQLVGPVGADDVVISTLARASDVIGFDRRAPFGQE